MTTFDAAAATLRVRDLMTAGVTALGPQDSLATLHDLFERRRIRHMPVIDGRGRLVGLVSQRDLLRAALTGRPDVPEKVERAVLERVTVGELMTVGPISVDPDTDVREAAQTMLDHKYSCLPVIAADGVLVGILTEADFVRLMARGD